MKRILYILSFAIISLAVSSCAKDEMEAPSDSNDGPKAIIMDDLENQIGGESVLDKNGRAEPSFIDDSEEGDGDGEILINNDGEILINDDGDDEDEELGPSKG